MKAVKEVFPKRASKGIYSYYNIKITVNIVKERSLMQLLKKRLIKIL